MRAHELRGAMPRAQGLRTALALWRGRPLADIVDLPWAQELTHRLDLLWLQAKFAAESDRLTFIIFPRQGGPVLDL